MPQINMFGICVPGASPGTKSGQLQIISLVFTSKVSTLLASHSQICWKFGGPCTPWLRLCSRHCHALRLNSISAPSSRKSEKKV